LKGVFVIDLVFFNFDEPGAYNITLIITDIRGNERTLGPDDLAAKGFLSQFILIGTTPDFEAPQLIQSEIDPIIVDPLQDVQLFLTISDNVSGFTFGSLLFQGPLEEDGFPSSQTVFFASSDR
jgi:hypothetical protein